jgi:MYXO-CTERM domain-containing protein
MKTLLRKLMLAGLILPGLVLARPGDIDTGAGPLPVLPIVRPDGSMYQIVLDSSAGLASRRVVLWNARATGGPLGQFEFSNPFGSNLWRIYDPVLLLANGDLLIPAVGPMGGSVPGALVSHVLRVRPDGLRDPGFGSGGVVSLDDESPEAPPRTKRVIAGLRELPDGRILMLESQWDCGLDGRDFGTFIGRTDGWDLCYFAASSLVRLLGDGRLDTTFGADGRTKLVSNSPPVMFEARADGGAVIALMDGTVQVLDASGRMAPVRELGWPIRAMLPQRDGRWLIVRDQERTQRGHVRFARLLADLQPDSSFGAGGEVDLWLGTLLAPRLNVGALVVAAELSGDATQVYVAMELTAETATPDGSVAPYRCTGVASFRLGPPFELDASFGKGGFSCLTHRYTDFFGQALLRQPDGGLLYSTLADSGWPDPTLRIFTDNSTGTGQIEVTTTSVEVGEGSGTASITVGRLAGRAGAIQADWSTRDWPSGGNAASAGSDYTASSGRLSWADGDDSERTISIPILEDSLQEARPRSDSIEYFSLDLTVPEPAGSPRVQTVTIGIRDNEPPVAVNTGSSTASTSAPASSPSGGGGSTGPLFLLALAGALWRRIRSRHPMITWVAASARGRRSAASG